MLRRRNHPLYPELLLVARELRGRLTHEEKLLWDRLRANRLGGYKFKRQHPIGRFIPDFICIEGRLVIEIDGGYHSEAAQIQTDAERTLRLESLGLKVLRFSNESIRTELELVLAAIQKELS